MSITKEIILDALRTVDDPDLKKDLVTLNMIRELTVEGNKVSFTVMLTTPSCPLKEVLKKNADAAVRKVVPADTLIEIKMDANVTSIRAKENVLPGVKNIIAVASGKGGVGKSTVAANLALGLAQTGSRVGLLDADIHGPSVPIMLNIKGMKPAVKVQNGKHVMIPIEQYGIKALSIGLLVDDKQAVVWRGPMVSSTLRQFISDCDWGDLDYLIVDLPPGTGDIHLTLVQQVPLTGAVIVTTPQDVALSDAKKGAGMFNINPINVPILGVIENMAYFTPEELPNNKYYIFGKGGGKKLADEFNVPLLGEVPIVQSIREAGDNGRPAVLEENSIVGAIFRDLAQTLARKVAIRNANFAPTRPVEITRM